MQRALVSLTIALLLLALGPATGGRASEDVEYSIEKVFYGYGWAIDPVTGVRRDFAQLNLTESFVRSYPDNGTFESFSQVFVHFSIPVDASGPANGTGLDIRFSYYVDSTCRGLNATTCPLGANQTAISQDVFDLEIHRILEYRDANGNGSYDPGEPVAQEIPLSQPLAPFRHLWAEGENGTPLRVPYLWNQTWESGSLTQGALFQGDAFLALLRDFWIAVGSGVPLNLTVNSFLFLDPTTYKGVPLTPSVLKLDLYMDGIRYAANDTSLALDLRLTSNHFRFSVSDTGTSESVYTNASAAEAFFTWSQNATIDNGVSAPVGSTILRDDSNSTTVYLSYPRASVVAHDPVLGFRMKEAPMSPPGSNPPAAGLPPDVPVAMIALLSGGVAMTAALLAHRAWRRKPR